jgi:hypothetical protein
VRDSSTTRATFYDGAKENKGGLGQQDHRASSTLFCQLWQGASLGLQNKLHMVVKVNERTFFMKNRKGKNDDSLVKGSVKTTSKFEMAESQERSPLNLRAMLKEPLIVTNDLDRFTEDDWAKLPDERFEPCKTCERWGNVCYIGNLSECIHKDEMMAAVIEFLTKYIEGKKRKGTYK